MNQGEDEHETGGPQGQPLRHPPTAAGEATPALSGRAVDLSPSPLAPADGHDNGHGPAAHDPLRLCIFATVALLAWLGGPFVLALFAALGLVGYVRARRAGLLRSKCLLGDTRLVLAYLGVLLAASAWGIWSRLSP